MGKRRKKKDAGTIIFRLIGIELMVLTSALVILGVIYLPGLISKLGLGKGQTVNQGADQTGNDTAVQNSTGTGNQQQAAGENQEQKETSAAVVQEDTTAVEEEEIASISLVAAGDNLMHRSSTLSGQQADGTYSFYSHFCNMQSIFEAADIAVISQDTVMAGEEYGVTSGEVFNTVPDVADSMEKAGIDVVLAANNHILDMGKDGLDNMISYIRENNPDLTLLGVNQSEEEHNTPEYLEVNGIRIAMVNYTCRSNKTDSLEAAPYLLNQKDDQWLEQILTQAREEADFVIVYPHWGTQNSLEITEDQQEQAQMLSDLGADLIIGSYPHVVEPVRWITGKDGNKTLVYYSLGNFQSIQDTAANMLGGLAEVTITKTNLRTYISDCGLDFVVTHYAQQSTNEYFDIVTTFPWDQYTENLAQMHGILPWDPEFSYERLDELRRQILDECEF